MTQPDLFRSETHDPGGRVRIALPAGIMGDATFSGERDEYRPTLRRWVGSAFPARHALFIGMNPSTASADHNDPTITREWGFTVREGLVGYVKCNIADYRATEPRKLLAPGLRLRSGQNRQTVLDCAKTAALVICCWGAVNRALAPIAEETLFDLHAAGIDCFCFGLTASGMPKHPLYLAKDTPLVPF